ncbi:MAG: TolC family protein [Desulfatitalea sp.]|nr:TolC family protein [Desulfatitalea sp.]NNK01466.1 TolC family protein [Desulfatitalea sp.]
MRVGGKRVYGYMLGVVIAMMMSAGAHAEQQQSADPLHALERVKVLDLKTAARIALGGNPSVAAAEARVRQASQVVKQAQALYWPQLDATLGGSRVDMSEREFAPQAALNSMLSGLDSSAQGIANPETYYQLGLKATWLIFDGLAREFRLATARYGEQAGVAGLDDVQRLLLSAVTSAYLQAQLAQENVAIAKADEAFNRRQLVETRLRYDVGTGSLSDVLNFEVRVNAAVSARIQEERGYRAGLVSLAALMGVRGGRLPAHVNLAELSATTDQELSTPQPTLLIETALTRRPDLQRVDRVVQQAEAGVKAAQADYYPTIALSADYTGNRPEDPGFQGDDFGNSIGIGLSWNIFAGGLTRARTAEARARLYETQRTRQDAHINVAAEIQRIANEIDTAQRVLTLQETNTKLVKQQRDLVEKEYKAGVGSLARLNQAQRDLNVARSQLAQARVALRVSWYNLLTATGEILNTFK